MSQTKLQYDLTTDPFPLQANPKTGDPVSATLTVVASNPNADPARNPVNVEGLSITLPVGPDASDLTSDVTGLGPVAADGWALSGTKPGAGTVEYVFTPQAGQGSVGGQGLAFVFNNVTVNTQPGTCQLIVKEGSAGDPTKALSVTKFPNGWGQVSFWLDPPEVAYQGSTTLHWDGPAGATYGIQYVLNNEVFDVPAFGAPPLAAQGEYPGQTDPPLSLEQLTVFTLSVEETISGQTYQAQRQTTASVLMPSPRIISFATSPAGLNGPGTQVTLSWQTANITELNVEDVKNFTGAEAAQGSVQLTRDAPELFLAQGYGVEGYSGPPATANACFGHAVSTGPITIPYMYPPTAVRTLSIDGDRPVFDVHVDLEGINGFVVWLELKPGVEVAELGTSGPATSVQDLSNATYSVTLPPTDLYGHATFINRHSRPYKRVIETSLPVGTAWGVQFGDGSRVLVWFEGVNYSEGESTVTANFVWFAF